MDNLGKKARDKVTGFEGVITGKVYYLYGCAQYCLVPKARNGKLGESEWFDIGRVEVFENDRISQEDVIADKPGGPNRDCPTRS